MGKPFIRLRRVFFTYPSAPEPLFQDISLHISPGWFGVVGANGTGKTTFLKLSTGILDPDKGHIEYPRDSLYCQQRTDNVPHKFNEFILTDSKETSVLKCSPFFSWNRITRESRS